MKRVYLVRHAKSSKDLPGIEDRGRPLNKRGKKEVARIGRRLKKTGVLAQMIYSSPAKRALDTAKGIAKTMGFPEKKIKVVRGIYNSSIPKLLKVIKSTSDRAQAILIFGHNPEFFNLVNYLSPEKVEGFPPCGAFGIDFKIDRWRKVARKKGKINFFASP
jgi:phosphohistidine phosphatase